MDTMKEKNRRKTRKEVKPNPRIARRLGGGGVIGKMKNNYPVLIRDCLYSTVFMLMLLAIPLSIIWGFVQLHLNGGIIFTTSALLSVCVVIGIEKIVKHMITKITKK